MKTFNSIMGLLLVGVVFTACSSTKQLNKQDMMQKCDLPSGYNLDVSINKGIDTIHKCNHRYDEVMKSLFDIASKSKSVENKKKLAHVAEIAMEASVVPRDKTKLEFQKYFSRSFVSIPSSRISVHTQCTNFDKIKLDLKNELAMKKIGFSKVQGLEDEYRQRAIWLKNYLFGFETLCSAKI